MNVLTSNTTKNVVKSFTFSRRTLIVIVAMIVVWLLFLYDVSVSKRDNEKDKKQNKKLI